MEHRIDPWPPVPVFFATTEGHTRRVAERFAQYLGEYGVGSMPVDLAAVGKGERSWEGVEGAVVLASVHAGGHQRVARRFARSQRDKLARVPTLFGSVCLAIASQNAADREAAEQIAASFSDKTGWQPDRTVSIAGCLAYTRYGWLKRLIMRRIAAKEGRSIDTTRDHEYTHWGDVREYAHELAQQVASERSSRADSRRPTLV